MFFKREQKTGNTVQYSLNDAVKFYK